MDLFHTKQTTFYQDRLGTDIGKVEKKASMQAADVLCTSGCPLRILGLDVTCENTHTQIKFAARFGQSCVVLV
jgi:hypothetical protein